jgi:hypothetical protein
MAKIKLSYKTREELPAGFEELYDEKDGVFHLTGVEGMKSQADIDRQQASLVAARADHKVTKDKLAAITAALGDLKPEDVVTKLDLVDELQAQVDAGKGKGSDEAIDRIVETRVKRALAPVERERDTLKAQVTTLTGERDGLTGTLKKGRIEDSLRKVANEMKVIGPAVEDVLLAGGNAFELDEANRVVTRDGLDGVVPGLTPDAWLKDMQEKRPHWWALSNGGGAGGNNKMPGGGPNPWSAGGWNLTEQGKYLTQHGVEKASTLAQQAGTSLNGPKPAQRAA